MTLLTTAASWTAAIATSLAVVVALFKDTLMRWLRRPIIKTSSGQYIPYVVRVPLRHHERCPNGVIVSECDAFWFRICVTNRGRDTARALEAFAERLERRAATGDFQPVERFIPASLTWAGLDAPVLPRLNPGSDRYLVALSILKPDDRACVLDNQAQTVFDRLHASGPVTELGVHQKDTSYSHACAPGEYRLRLAISGENVDTVRFIFEFAAPSVWPTGIENFAEAVGLTLRDGA